MEVLSWRGLVTYYVLFFIHLESRRVSVAGITRHPDQEWMEQIARSATQETWGYLHPCRYVLHDRDTKFCASFRSVLAAGGVKAHSASGQKPESERFCGTLGPLCQAGVLVEVDPVRRAPFVAGLGRIQRSLSRRKKSSRERQPIAFPRGWP